MKKVFLALALIFSIFASTQLPAKIFANENNPEIFTPKTHSNFQILTESHMYAVNLSTNQIEEFKNGEISKFGEYGNTDGKFTEVKFFLKLKNGEFVVLDSLNRLQFFDSNFNHLKTLQHIFTVNTFKPLGNIVDICKDIYSNIYLLDETNNLILKANSNMENIEAISSTASLKNCKITFLNNTNQIVILKDNKIILENIEKSHSDVCFEIFSDALNFIYVVQENQIIKYNNKLEMIDQKQIEKGTSYNVDLTSGKIYYYLNFELKTIDSFASNISEFTPPIDVTENKSLSNKAEICKLAQPTELLVNPYSTESEISFEENDKVIKLALTKNFEVNFAYVMFVKNSTTYLGYVENKYLLSESIETTNYNVKPVREKIKYYKYPALKSYLVDNNELIYNKTYLTTRKIMLDNTAFLEIKNNDNFVYVLENELIDANNNYIDTYFTANAKLKLFNQEKEIKIYDNINKESILAKIYKTTNIKLIKNVSDELALIELLIDNQIVTGYVETKYIQTENYIFIPLTICLALISVIVLMILIIKFKKELTKRNRRQNI